MLQQGISGDIDWMSLAAKMFINKLNNRNSTQKQHVGKKAPASPPPPPLRMRSPMFSPRTRIQETTSPSHLSPDCVATIKQFEALRIQLLRQLVLYQTQLLALRMPPLPGQHTNPVQKTGPPKERVVHKSKKVKKQTSSKKVKFGQGSDTKKWERIQFSGHALKNQNNRRGQVFQKPKKSVKKASKRKHEDIQTSGSNNHFESHMSKINKKPCQSYQTCLRNYSSSTDSFYSSRQGKYNSFNFISLKGKDMDHQNSSFTNSTSTNECKNKTPSVLKSPKRKASKLSKKISSAFVFDTPTDEAQSSL